jgi:hypothetical protein
MPARSTTRIELVLGELSCVWKFGVAGQAEWIGGGMGRGRGKGERGGQSTWKVCLLKLRLRGLEPG